MSKSLSLSLIRYWVVLGVFSLVELLLDLAINPLAYSFPAYLILKCAFLAWCMAPVEWNGSDVIFNNVSDSYPLLYGRSLTKYQRSYDDCLDPVPPV